MEAHISSTPQERHPGTALEYEWHPGILSIRVNFAVAIPVARNLISEKESLDWGILSPSCFFFSFKTQSSLPRHFPTSLMLCYYINSFNMLKSHHFFQSVFIGILRLQCCFIVAAWRCSGCCREKDPVHSVRTTSFVRCSRQMTSVRRYN